MRKFKVFMASLLAYLMLISLVPSSLVEKVVKATENDYIITVKNDNYFKSGVQYGDELIIAYSNNIYGKLFISSIKNGVEIILKEVDGYLGAELYQDGDIIKIKYYGEGKFNSDTCYYEKLNLKNKTFEEIDQTEWNNTIVEDYIRDYKITSDEDIEYNLDKISKNSELKVSIKGANRLGAGYDTRYENETQIIDVEIKKVNKNIDLLYGKIVITEKKDNNFEVYDLAMYNNNVYIKKTDDYIYESIRAKYDEQNKLAIIIEGDYFDSEKGCKITEMDSQGNKITRESEIKVSYTWSNVFKRNNKLYVYEDSIKVYGLKNNKYVLENEINSGIHSESINQYDDNYFFLDKETRSLNKLDNKGNVSKFIEIGEAVDLLRNEVYITNYKNNDVLIKGYNHFIIVQNKLNQTEDKPTENTKLDIEVPTLKPNEVNEIPVVSTNTKNFNVIVKDIETLKNGEGSLKLALNNVTLNLPFSVVDKDLLDGNDTVSVKLDVLADSEITKDLKAVNKVFDFNLVVNKENESVKIHNFKDGVAEITFALTDSDLEGLNRNNLVVYYYNEETKNFEAMETKVEGNNVTFTTSHFSKYIISEKIADKDTVTKPDEDKNEEVIIKPDTDKTDDSTTNSGTTNNEESSNEAGKGNLPETGSVISNNVMLAIALVTVLVGTAIFFRRKKVA